MNFMPANRPSNLKSKGDYSLSAFVLKMATVAVVKSLTKLAIGGGAVYATVQQGIWTTNTDLSTKVFQKVKTSVAPTAIEYISKIPSGQELNKSVVTKWNKGVVTTFGTLAEAPEYSKSAWKSTKQLLNENGIKVK